VTPFEARAGAQSASTSTTEDIDLRPIEPDASLGELIGRLGRDLSDLLSSQVELAKVELREEARAGAKAGGMLGAGGALGYLALAFLLTTIAFALDLVMPTWLAFGIVTVVVGIVAAVLVMSGRKKLQDRDPLVHTRQTIKDDKNITEDAKEELAWTAPQKT
jgi:uncharacterized membrane protein YqjE